MRIKIDVGAIVGGGKGHCGAVGRKQAEVGGVGHEGLRVEGEILGTELREAEAQCAVGGIAFGRESCHARELCVAIQLDGVADGLGGQFRLVNVPFQLERIGVGHRIERAIGHRLHPKLVGDARNGVEIEHETVGIERGRLIVKLSVPDKTIFGQDHILMETSQIAIHGIRIRFAVANLMDEAQRIVIHDDQRLFDVGKDAARDQLAIEPDMAHREVGEAVDDEGMDAIVELAF